jgi:hypothetical protein
MQFAPLAARHYISDRRKQRTAASRTAGSSATPAARMARLTTFKTLKTGIGFEGFEGSGHLIVVMPVPLDLPYMWSSDALLVARLPRLMSRDSAARPAS